MEILVTVFWIIIGALIGAYINHKFSIYLEKRKEFNALAEPIVFTLIKLYKYLLITKSYVAIRANDFEHDNFEKIYYKLSYFKKRKLNKLIDRFNKSLGVLNSKSVSIITDDDNHNVLINLTKLEKFLMSRY